MLKPQMLRAGLLLTAVLWFGGNLSSLAATNVVYSTDDLQTRINEAAPGDIMVLEGGTYAGNISITKPLSFARSGTNAVQWLGNVTLTTSGKVVFIQMNYSLPITVSGGSDISFYDCLLSSTLNVNGGRLVMKRTAVNAQIDIVNADFQGNRITNSTWITSSAPVEKTNAFVLTQSQAAYLSVTRCSVFAAYNNFASIRQYYCSSVLVGNTLENSYATGDHPMILCEGGNIRAYNNRIVYANNLATGNIYVDGIRCNTGCTGEIINNYFWSWSSSNMDRIGGRVSGVTASGASALKVKSNIFLHQAVGNSIYVTAVHASATEISELSYCVLYALDNARTINGGVVGYNMIYGNPQVQTDGTPVLNSPCINAGPPDNFMRDRDGTRNDIGPAGGSLYLPDGRSTDKPLLFWLFPEKQKVPINTLPFLKVEAAATAGH